MCLVPLGSFLSSGEQRRKMLCLLWNISVQDNFFFFKLNTKCFFSLLLILRPAQTRGICLERRDWSFGERKDIYKTSLCQSKCGENQAQSTSPSGNLKGKFMMGGGERKKGVFCSYSND